MWKNDQAAAAADLHIAPHSKTPCRLKNLLAADNPNDRRDTVAWELKQPTLYQEDSLRNADQQGGDNDDEA
jgi:hypothetical protein